MRNNTNYSQTATLAALQLASSNPAFLLENFYRKSRNAVADGARNPPHGFVVPAGHGDMTRAAMLVNLLRIQGVEIGRADGALALGDRTYPAGSYVVKGGQPYFRLAKILLGSQEFPDDGLRTYDDTGWTMGLMHRTEVVAIEDPAVLDAPVEQIGEARVIGTVAGSREGRFGYAVAHYGSNHLTTLRYRLGEARVEAAEESFEAGGVEFPPGSFIVEAPPGSDRGARLQEWIADLGLTARARRPAGGRDAPGRPAPARDLQHLGQHPGGGLGAPCLRPVRDPVRPHLQGARPGGRPAGGLRRHP